jgi:uncharacterized membrane protein
MTVGNYVNSDSGSTRPPVFRARLSPHRSLSRNGFQVLMLFVGATCFASGIMFWAIGAWPVIGFMGVDVLLVWVAFRMNYRAARAFEEVAIWSDDLRVRQVCPAGRVNEHSFNPFWTRFFVNRHEEIGIVAMGIRGEGRELVIGSFLNPLDRESFAAAFSKALAGVKRS